MPRSAVSVPRNAVTVPNEAISLPKRAFILPRRQHSPKTVHKGAFLGRVNALPFLKFGRAFNSPKMLY